jgi:hypothetical protein
LRAIPSETLIEVFLEWMKRLERCTDMKEKYVGWTKFHQTIIINSIRWIRLCYAQSGTTYQRESKKSYPVTQKRRGQQSLPTRCRCESDSATMGSTNRQPLTVGIFELHVGFDGFWSDGYSWAAREDPSSQAVSEWFLACTAVPLKS